MKGNFQIIILIIFIVAAVFGVMVFSGAIKIGSDKGTASQGTVVLWGTVKTQLISTAIEEFNRANPTVLLKYVQKSKDTFDQDLLEALASGTGPDIFFLPDNLAFHYKNKIFPIPYQSFPVSSFKNIFAEAGEVFLTANGALAFPMTIDPMVMYYNRSMLDANSIVYPPVYWDDFHDLVPLLTKKDDSKKIIKSAVAMGQFSNINNAKDIISTFFMQMGNSIITQNNNGVFSSVLGENTGSNLTDLGPVLSFYTDFANPLKSVYSWNKSFPNSRDVFSADNSAFYFGYANELQLIVNKNPNLNFSVASMPQIKNASFKLTSARVTGVAVLASSKNLNTAFSVASLMATTDFAPKFSNALSIPPARRDLLATKPTDAYFPTFFSSALYGRSWLDPSPEDTDNIFEGMIDKVLSNNMSASDAVKDADAKLRLLLAKYK